MAGEQEQSNHACDQISVQAPSPAQEHPQARAVVAHRCRPPPRPAAGRGGEGVNGAHHGASRTLHVRGARHYGSGVVESEDQHEREMENKEQ